MNQTSKSTLRRTHSQAMCRVPVIFWSVMLRPDSNWFIGPWESGSSFKDALFNLVLLICIFRASNDDAISWVNVDPVVTIWYRNELNVDQLDRCPWLLQGDIWGLVGQKQIPRTETNNYTPQILLNVFTCPCPWCLLAVHIRRTHLLTAI